MTSLIWDARDAKYELGTSHRVSYAPLGWAVASDSGWSVFVLDQTIPERYLHVSAKEFRFHAVRTQGPCASMKDGMELASGWLLAAMKSRYEAILDWQTEPETAGAPSGADMVFCSPVARAIVSRLSNKWSTHSICGQQRSVEEVWTTQDAHGIGYTYERARNMARDSLADVTAYRTDMLLEWLQEHTPPVPAPTRTYIDLLSEALKDTPGGLFDGAFPNTHKVDVSLDGVGLRIVLQATFQLIGDRSQQKLVYGFPGFSVEKGRVFSGPLFCRTCDLPAVPFGGQEICLDPNHDHRDAGDAPAGARVDTDDDEDKP